VVNAFGTMLVRLSSWLWWSEPRVQRWKKKTPDVQGMRCGRIELVTKLGSGARRSCLGACSGEATDKRDPVRNSSTYDRMRTYETSMAA